jgi:hypothetical protein
MMRTLIGRSLQGAAAGALFAVVGIWAWIAVIGVQEWAKRNGLA